jgi:hypothetical protein
MTKDTAMYNLGRSALAQLAQNRRQGFYHVIRNPEGVISMWAIEGEERGPFRISFANKGRISGKIEDMPPEFVKAFVEFVRKTILKR